MSMHPQALPAAISLITFSQRVALIRPVVGSMSVLPSRAEKTSAAIAMPAWKPWCAMADTSALAIISLLMKYTSMGAFMPPSSRGSGSP